MTTPVAGPGIVQFIEQGKYVGSRLSYMAGASIGGESVSGFWPHVAYFCTECGDLWARAIWSPEGKWWSYHPLPSAKWRVELSHCQKHDGGFLLQDTPSLDDCSPELLQREAFLYLFQGIT